MEGKNGVILFEQDKLMSKVSNSLRIAKKLLPIKSEPELIPYRKGDKWGFCNPYKKIIIECKFDYVNFFEGHFADVTINKKKYLIDRNGTYTKKEPKNIKSFKFKNQYDEVEGRNFNGKKIKNYHISNGMVAVKKKNKFGFVNLRNEIIIPFDYDWDANCVFLLSLYPFPIFKDGVVFLKKNSKWGAIDTNGKIIVPFIYDSYGFHDLIDFRPSEGFVDNFVNVKFKGKWGIIDRNGKTIIPLEYEMCYNFYENLAIVKLNNKYGVIDKNNKQIIPLIYDEISNFKGGLFEIKINNKYGLIDRAGNLVVDPIYDYLNNDMDYIIVGQYGKRGVIDFNGKLIIDLMYEDVAVFKQDEDILKGSCFFVKNHNKWGIVDLNNNLLVDFKYDDIERWCTKYAKVWHNKQCLGYIDKKGTEYWED